MDSYGCRMYSTPVFKISGSKMLWVVSTPLLNTETLWRAICSIQMRTSAWHGYLLVYLTKECIPQIHRRTVGIFPKLSIKELSEKIQGNINQIFGNDIQDIATVIVEDGETIESSLDDIDASNNLPKY